jgi:hypothetical protein
MDLTVLMNNRANVKKIIVNDRRNLLVLKPFLSINKLSAIAGKYLNIEKMLILLTKSHI